MKSHLKIRLLIILLLWFDKVLQDVAGGTRPTSHTVSSVSSVSDANLMFELLLGGVVMDQDRVFLLDEEMASMRKGRQFLAQINDGIPKSLSSTELMVRAHRRKPLSPDQFDNLVLSLVYSAHQARVQESEEERQAWGGVLLQLANITVYELRGSFLFSYS